MKKLKKIKKLPGIQLIKILTIDGREVMVKGKPKRMAKNQVIEGRRKDWKKAYVTLKEGHRLDII